MRTHYRGRILIQASLKVDDEEARRLKLDPDELRSGAIVGSVEIVDCIRGAKRKWANRGHWHWLLKNPLVLAKPIPLKGKLGFIRVPDRLLKGARFRAPVMPEKMTFTLFSWGYWGWGTSTRQLDS